jgi:dCTP deaminase
MSFWSSETIKGRTPKENLITPYNEDNVKHCAYELTMGPEAFVTSSDSKTKLSIEPGQPIVIPPGQLAMLLTEEVVTIPTNVIGFISMRFSVKSQGLINVSGFHVDPGFAGKLKFSVYNAGSQDITVSRGDRLFMLWLSNLDQQTVDSYGGQKKGQNEINSSDQNKMHGEIASPGQLKKEINELQSTLTNIKTTLAILITLALSIVGFEIKGCHDSGSFFSKSQSPVSNQAGDTATGANETATKQKTPDSSLSNAKQDSNANPGPSNVADKNQNSDISKDNPQKVKDTPDKPGVDANTHTP